MKVVIIGKDSLVASQLLPTLYTESIDILALGKEDELSNAISTNESFDFGFFLAQSPEYKSAYLTNNLFDVNCGLIQRTLLLTRGVVSNWIVFSSGSVYVDTEQYIDETSPLCWLSKNPYIVSKLIMEKIVESFTSEFETITIVRPFYIYGPGQKSGFLLPQIVSKLTTGSPIFVNSDGGLIFNPIHVCDVADILTSLIKDFENLKPVNGIINLFGPEHISLLDCIQVLGRLLGKAPFIKHDQTIPEKKIIGASIHQGIKRAVIQTNTGLKTLLPDER